MFAVSSRFTEAGAKRIANRRRATPRRDALIAASRESGEKAGRSGGSEKAGRTASRRWCQAAGTWSQSRVPSRRSTRAIWGGSRHGITRSMMCRPFTRSTSRPGRFDAVRGRQMAYPGMSLPMLGQLFRSDHTTFCNALRVGGPLMARPQPSAKGRDRGGLQCGRESQRRLAESTASRRPYVIKRQRGIHGEGAVLASEEMRIPGTRDEGQGAADPRHRLRPPRNASRLSRLMRWYEHKNRDPNCEGYVWLSPSWARRNLEQGSWIGSYQTGEIH